VDDVNNMDESTDRVEHVTGVTEKAWRASVDRRTMLKAAVATGTIAATWVAPRIETFGFAPAGAATVCTFTNEAKDDLQQNSADTTYVSTSATNPGPARTRCPGNGSSSFGSSSATTPDRIQFGSHNKPLLPGTNCTTFTVRTRPQDCPPTSSTNVNDPDNTGFAVVVDLQNSDAACDCHIDHVTIGPVETRANPTTKIFLMFTPAADPYLACTTALNGVPATGPGVLIDFDKYNVDPCTVDADARISVTIVCNTAGSCH